MAVVMQRETDQRDPPRGARAGGRAGRTSGPRASSTCAASRRPSPATARPCTPSAAWTSSSPRARSSASWASRAPARAPSSPCSAASATRPAGSIAVDGIDLYGLPGERLADFRREYLGLRLPVVQPRAVPDGARERDAAAGGQEDAVGAEKRARAARGPGARRARRPRRPPAGQALGRRAGARGHRPRARQRAAAHPRRRAHRRPRQRDDGGDHGPVRASSTARATRS